MDRFSHDIKQSIETLKNGGIILYPTDTIWGIGCDAANKIAVKKIYAIKERKSQKGMIILFDSIEHIEKFVANIPDRIKKMMTQDNMPLTVIFPDVKGVAENLLAKDKSLAIRKTDEPFSNKLIKQFGKPIVSTSANKSGSVYPSNFSKISPTIIQAVDYVVSYKQEEKRNWTPSRIVKILADNSVQIIRK